MNLRDFEYVVKVADYSHFGRAADACHVSQPALSGQIKKLEQELGVTLFERTNKSVAVTPVGERIVAQARELLAQAEQIKETAAAHRDPFAGDLSLGVIPTIGPYITPSLLPAIARDLPKLHIQLIENMTATLERQLRDGEIDAAITATPPNGKMTDPKLAEIPLYDEPFCIALPKAHPLAAQDSVDVRDLDQSELLLLSDGHCLRDQVLSFCNVSARASDAAKTHQTSLSTLFALVGAGAGVTLAPATAVQGSWLAGDAIAVRSDASGKASRAVRLIFRASFPRRAVLEKLAHIIRAAAPDTVEVVEQ
jgi:LysR family hydrogen peroxide-inducible transcriptional activator